MLRDKELLEAIRQKYHLHPTNLTWFDSLYRKHVAARFDTENRSFKVKRFAGARARLVRLAQQHAWLRNKTIAQMPKWYLTADGKDYFQCDGDLFYVTDWVDGRAFNHTEADAYALGQTLGEIHVPLPADSTFNVPQLERRLRPVIQAKRILQTRSFQQMPRGVRQFVRREMVSINQALDVSVTNLHRLKSDLRVSTVHGDVTIPNLLYRGRRAHLIDWELLGGGFASEELAKAAMNTCNLSGELVDKLLDGYGFRSWNAADKQAFQAFLHIPREVVYLLHRVGKSTPTKQDAAQWQLVMQTWRDRMALIERYPL